MTSVQQARFRRVWSVLAKLGMCDGLDGAEYRRILTEWSVLDCAPPLGRFIILNANGVPFEHTGPFVPPGVMFRFCPECAAIVRCAWVGGQCLYEDHLKWEGPSGSICPWSGQQINTLYIVSDPAHPSGFSAG